MTSLKSTLQLLVLGALLSPAYLQVVNETCLIIRNTPRRGSYRLDVEPAFYKPDATYTVTVTGLENGTSIVLQALPTESNSSGAWVGKEHIMCSLSENIVQDKLSGHSFQIQWKAPSDAHVQDAEIRAFVTFTNGTTLRQSRTLSKDLTMAVVTPPAPSRTATPHKPTPHSHGNEAHIVNATAIHHNFAASHQSPYQSPKGSAWTAPASNLILAATQFLTAFLGFKLLA